jgi:N6-adenosine-specific RNA methylase IME4
MTEAGEPQEQVAGDYGITEVRASKIYRAERKRRERAAELTRQIADIRAGRVTVAEGPFDVIVVDPPWPYGTKYDPEGRRAANPYPEMSLEEIARLDVAKCAAPDCVLWLWTTHKFMRHSFELLDKWGFRTVTIFTWKKNQLGLGYWSRSNSEFVIMAVRGAPVIEPGVDESGWTFYGKRRQHSRKPDEFFAMAEELCAGARRYDWFGREQREGWTVGGNDTEKFRD